MHEIEKSTHDTEQFTIISELKTINIIKTIKKIFFFIKIFSPTLTDKHFFLDLQD